MSNQIRIIGGAWRSRLVKFPDQAGLRPTADRVRVTLFNWLGQTLDGKVCLDLFAGSGALGFEAASRGAAQVTLVERNPKVLAALRETVTKLAADQVRVVAADGAQWLRADSGRYDVIFVDPPFQTDLLEHVLPLAAKRLTDAGVIYVESGAPLDPPQGLCLTKHDRAGQVYYGLMRNAEHA